MRHFPCQLVLTLAALAVLGGCASTPYHTKVRDDANERVNLVQAQLTYDQARQQYETGQFDKALRSIDVAIARVPEVSNFHLLRGRILVELNRLEPALHAFDDSIAANESNDKAHYFRGIVLQRWSRFDEAFESYQRAYDLQNGSVQYLTASAEMLITIGRFDDARHMIEPRMAYFEHNATLRQLLGQIALLQRNYAEASSHFSEARMLSPEDSMLLEDLANAQFAAQQYERAYLSIRELYALLGTERPDLMHMEARCLAMTDRTREARNLYLRLTQESPGNSDVWIELGNVAYSVGDYRRVALSASRAIALAPTRFEGHLLMGLYEQNQGNRETALEHFQRASELAPDVAWPHLLLGMMHEEVGRGDQALVCYAAALRAEPDNSRARHLFQMASSEVGASTSGKHGADVGK